MRRSKPEIYVNILQVLAFHGPLAPTHIVHKAKMNYSALRGYMNSLVKQNLVEKRTLGDENVEYAITKRGWSVLKCLRDDEYQTKPIELFSQTSQKTTN